MSPPKKTVYRIESQMALDGSDEEEGEEASVLVMDDEELSFVFSAPPASSAVVFSASSPTTQLHHSVVPCVPGPRPLECWLGVQAALSFISPSPAPSPLVAAGMAISTSSHQSHSVTRSSGMGGLTLRERNHFLIPSGTRKWMVDELCAQRSVMEATERWS